MSASEMYPYFTGNGSYKAVNPLLSRVGDFTPFYIAIAICSVLLGFMIVLNVVCCCSRYSDYWLDRHTGNRWVVSLWSASPHKQPPLDYTELRAREELGLSGPAGHTAPLELGAASQSRQPLTSSQDYLEMHRRESDI